MESAQPWVFNRLEPPFLDDPYPLYARARREAPVFHSPEFGLWFVTRYDDAWAVLKDTARFSSRFLMRTPADAPPAVGEVLREAYPELPMLVNDDPPSHTRTRGLVNHAFAPRLVAALEPSVRAIVTRLVDGFAPDGGADLIAELAYPVPIEIICTLVGLPVEERGRLKRWTDDLVELGAPGTGGERQLECARSSVAFQHYLEAQIEARRSEPRDDLLTALIDARVDGERPLDVAELVNLLIILIFGGHETTTNLIGNLLVLLLARPETLRAVRDDPSLTDAVITEGLRMDTPVQGTFRTTTEEVALGGTRIPAGAKVMVLFGSANRDDAVFSHPDRFDPGRSNNNRHLGFGRGIHACLGASLARLETRIVLDTIAERLPDPKLDAVRPPTYFPSLMHRGPQTLNVVWQT
ncbi:cytochrome P450 [Actinomadura sp. KC06]|uniref:cytochrome P450 n=1 Tax=Actinomadura sp. KC06 TaxID=2530369 RepID=UPI00104C98FC|nr:cytochrome P450 [Actinomadura sp. KC06]TDD31874.1 cytochrome P450 [Actinomadura sp. KC06]